MGVGLLKRERFCTVCRQYRWLARGCSHKPGKPFVCAECNQLRKAA